MSDNPPFPEGEDAREPGDDPSEPILVELILPAGLVSEYDELASKGIYLSRQEAMRHGLVTSWRHDRGRWHTIRLDLLDSGDRRPDSEAAAPETGEAEAGEPEDGES